MAECLKNFEYELLYKIKNPVTSIVSDWIFDCVTSTTTHFNKSI